MKNYYALAFYASMLGLFGFNPLNSQTCTTTSFCGVQLETDCGCADVACGCALGPGNCKDPQIVVHTCTIPAYHTFDFRMVTDSCSKFSGLDGSDYVEYTSNTNGDLTMVWGGGNDNIDISHSITTGSTPLTFQLNFFADRKDECVDFVVTSLVLPLELLDVSIEEEGEDFIISMETNEINVKSVVLEHSNDAYNWNPIEDRVGHNTLSGEYTFRHSNVSSKHNYYRIRSYDYDGSENISEVIYQHKKTKSIAVRKQYGNSYYVDLPSDDSFEIQIYDGSGKLIHTETGKGDSMNFDLMGLKGLFLVSAIQAGNTYVTKIIN